MVVHLPWLGSGGGSLVLVRYLLACPCGATVPLDSLVRWCSWSSRWVTCLRSGLCSSSVRNHDIAFPLVGGFDFWPLCGVPYLRLTLWASACVGPGGCPAFSRVGPAPLPWVPLLWTWLVWEASPVFIQLPLPSGCGHPFGSISVFCHYRSQTKVSIGGGFLYDVASHLGVVSSFSYVLCRFVGAPSGW